MNRKFATLMDYLEQRSCPASVISVKSTRSKSVSSNDIESVTSKVRHTSNQLMKRNSSMHVLDEPQPEIKDEHTTKLIPSHIPPSLYAKKDKQNIEKHLSTTLHIPPREMVQPNWTYYEKDDNSEARHRQRRSQMLRYLDKERSILEHNNNIAQPPKIHNTNKEHNENREHEYECENIKSEWNSNNNIEEKHQFAQNNFSIACTGGKIKYSDMTTYLKDKQIKNDSQFELEQFYNAIVRSIDFAYQRSLMVMPEYRNLEQTMEFKTCFLKNLVGSTLTKCHSAFIRLGDIIKEVLTCEKIISKDKCPMAYLAVDTHKVLDGWTILEELLRDRSVICGASPDVDLDILVSHLTFKHNESYHSFYARTTELINKFKLQYRYDNMIPIIKIVRRFLQELMRALEYVPYLAHAQVTLQACLDEIDVQAYHVGQDRLPYLVKQLYQKLRKAKVSDIPTSLKSSVLEEHEKLVSSMEKKNNDITEKESDLLRSIVAILETSPEVQL